VELVKIDVIRFESPKTGFTAFNDVESAISDQVWLVGHPAVDLGGEKYLVVLAVTLQRFTNKIFGRPIAVDIGCVEEVDSFTDGVVDYFAGVFEVGLLAEHHAAQHERAYVYPGASKEFVFHRFPVADFIDFNEALNK